MQKCEGIFQDMTRMYIDYGATSMKKDGTTYVLQRRRAASLRYSITRLCMLRKNTGPPGGLTYFIGKTSHELLLSDTANWYERLWHVDETRDVGACDANLLSKRIGPASPFKAEHNLAMQYLDRRVVC